MGATIAGAVVVIVAYAVSYALLRAPRTDEERRDRALNRVNAGPKQRRRQGSRP